jgi:hypothetical protein
MRFLAELGLLALTGLRIPSFVLVVKEDQSPNGPLDI